MSKWHLEEDIPSNSTIVRVVLDEPITHQAVAKNEVLVGIGTKAVLKVIARGMCDSIYDMLVKEIDGLDEAEIDTGSSGDPIGAGLYDLIDACPGLDKEVKHPLTGQVRAVRRIVMNLNDEHNWTYQQIADWLDTLDVDLSITPLKKEVEHADN